MVFKMSAISCRGQALKAGAGTLSRRLPVALGIGLILVVSGAEPAVSYIDPGGVQLIWGSLAPIIGILGVVAASCLWIFRHTVWTLFASIRRLAGTIAVPVRRLMGRGRKGESTGAPE